MKTELTKQQTMYDQLLRVCVATFEEEKYREWMHNPFRIDNKALATDGLILAVVDSSLAPKINPLNETIGVNPLSVIPTERLKTPLIIPLSTLIAAIDNCPIVDEMADGRYECDACNGEGEVDVEFHYKRTYYLSVECPVCHGDGMRGRLSPTGNKIPKGFIQIEASYFSSCLCERLIKAAKAIEVEEIQLIQQSGENKASLFRVGLAEILLMPAYRPEEVHYKIES